MVAEALGGVDGIVIGDGDQVHAATLEQVVDFVGVVIAFAADPVQHARVHIPEWIVWTWRSQRMAVYIPGTVTD